MSDIPNLKLINAVDPTKIKVTINEKFSKLTLSSSKKRNNETEKPAETREIEKRQSASRNLLEDFIDNNQDNVKYSNAILRSSSSAVSEGKNETELTETLTHVDNVYDESKNTTQSMERLHISDENELGDLTQKVSNLTVDQECIGVKHDQSLCKTNSFGKMQIIELNSDESDDEESVICVSDSEDENPPPGPEEHYNLMITSDIVQSGQTGEPQLPCTLSNERADRIEAFLRDVSQERRNIVATGNGLAEDSFLVYLPTPTENIENALRNSFKAKQMATADTESLKTNTNSARFSPDLLKQKTNIALNDTEAISESANVTLLSPEHKNINDQANKKILESRELVARRLANDETEANTTIVSLNDIIQDSAQSQGHIFQEESIIISESSCEESNVNDSNCSQPQVAGNHDLIPSEELSEPTTLSPSGYSKEPPIEPSIGSINISAQINIKLQIRTNINISDESSSSSQVSATNRASSSSGDDEGGDGNDGSIKECNENDENVSNESRSEYIAKEKQTLKPKINLVPCTLTPESNTNFMSKAEKILAELYGQSWQTPDVLKTLKRSENFKESGKFDNAITKISTKTKTAEESQLVDDFSTFRINIEKTNLDSTRLVTPKQRNETEKRIPKQVVTEPKQKTIKKAFRRPFKAPQTEFKKKAPKPINERWRLLVDSDSESERDNASDDDHIEKTLLTEDESATDENEASNASDSSWQALTEDESSVDDDEDNGDDRDKKKSKSLRKTPAKTANTKKAHPKDELIYMDLSKDEISIVQKSDSPPANHDENFQKHLSEILDSCRHQDKPKLEVTPKPLGKSKRRLFTPKFSSEDGNDGTGDENVLKEKNSGFDNLNENSENVRFNGVLIPPSFNIFDKRLESVKTGKPVFKLTPPRLKQTNSSTATREESTPFKTPQLVTTPKAKDKRKLNEICSTPSFRYSFLKSLDVCVGKSLCHPDALVFRENYRQKKEDLAKILYELYNKNLFNNDLNVPLQWNKKLLNTAGRCLNKKKAGVRLSVVELSDKVLTSADRLRCTLIHELCHAATWVFNGEGGHGATWKEWARKANAVFPDLPKIGVCHQYDIEYKYTYKCTLCAAKSYYHSKSKKVENIRCSYCYGAIEIFLNKKDKEGNIMPTPVKEPTGFAKFVKEKYQQYKSPNMKHAEVMKMLSNKYAALKVSDKAK